MHCTKMADYITFHQLNNLLIITLEKTPLLRRFSYFDVISD